MAPGLRDAKRTAVAQRLAATAFDQVRERGFGEVTVDDVVAEAEVSRRTFSNYYSCKEAAVAAVERSGPGLWASIACRKRLIDDRVSDPFNSFDAVVVLGAGFDYVIDAIDSVRVKVAMIAFCRSAGVPVVTCGAAGGQIDPTQIRVDDLSRTIQDPLLAKVRGQLRKGHGFTRDPKKKFGVEAVFSTEPLRYPAPDAACELPASGPAGLNCAGFGSIVTVTACVGMFAAARAINALAAEQ